MVSTVQKKQAERVNRHRSADHNCKHVLEVGDVGVISMEGNA
jgi:hypothetical protein